MDSRNSKVLIMMVNSMDERLESLNVRDQTQERFFSCLESLNVRDQTQERFFSCLHFLCSTAQWGFVLRV